MNNRRILQYLSGRGYQRGCHPILSEIGGSSMRAVLIIMPCSLAGMKMGKPGTLFFVGFMIPEKNLLKSSRRK